MNKTGIIEKRAHERSESNIPVNYFCNNCLYTGTIENLSENGICVNTCNFLPCDNILELLIPLEEELSKFYGAIRRIEKKDDYNFKIGIELLEPPANYIKFVKYIRSLS